VESESFGLVNSPKFSRLHARKPHFGNAHPWRERGSDPSGLAGRQWEAESWKTLAASPGGIARERGNPCLGRPRNTVTRDAASPFRRKVPGAGNAIKSGGLCQARPATRGRPDETRETVERTLDLLARLGPAHVQLSYGVRILPFTPLAERAKAEGLIEKDGDCLHPCCISPRKSRTGSPAASTPPPAPTPTGTSSDHSHRVLARGECLRRSVFTGSLWKLQSSHSSCLTGPLL
jgi:hypothetical protein